VVVVFPKAPSESMTRTMATMPVKFVTWRLTLDPDASGSPPVKFHRNE
jgi:hypothetical protein